MSLRPGRMAAVLVFVSIGLFPLPARVAPASPAEQAWATLSWDQDVGRIDGQEADSEGPKSFAVQPDGSVIVLDQVNLRILRVRADGTLADAVRLPSPTFDDLEVFGDGSLLVLDRLGTKRLIVLRPDGAVVREVEVEGRGIEQAGLITAMLPRPDGVWLEVRHRYSVKVLDRRLEPCTRQVVLGRPVRNGLSLVGKLDRGGATVTLQGRARSGTERSVRLVGGAPVRRIVWLDADERGHVHAVLHEVERSEESPFRVLQERYTMVELDGDLREIRRRESPWTLTLYDQRVEFRVGPGGLWQMAFAADGVRLVDWGRRTP